MGNCVAIGLSSGFLEPLESTNIHLIHSAIRRLLALFPDRSFDPVLAERFNAEMDEQVESVRDFIMAHYVCTERDDTPFWRHCRAMAIPDTLAHKIEQFRRRGEVPKTSSDFFGHVSWFSVLHGQGIIPQACHPLTAALPSEAVRERLRHGAGRVALLLQRMPPYSDFVPDLNVMSQQAAVNQ